VNDAKFRLVKAYKLRDYQDRVLCQSAQCLIFPSQVMQEDYYHNYPFLTAQHKPYVVAHPGALLASPSSKTQPLTSAKTSSAFTFLFVGRGYRRKGLDVLLSAASLLARGGRDFRLLIAGLRAKPLDRARLALMGLADKVEYLGFQKDMDKVYA